MRTLVRFVFGASLIASMSALGAVNVALAAPAAGGCQLQGLANLSPGLSSTSQAFSYSFTGNLTGCQSNVAGAILRTQSSNSGRYLRSVCSLRRYLACSS